MRTGLRALICVVVTQVGVWSVHAKAFDLMDYYTTANATKNAYDSAVSELWVAVSDYRHTLPVARANGCLADGYVRRGSTDISGVLGARKPVNLGAASDGSTLLASQFPLLANSADQCREQLTCTEGDRLCNDRLRTCLSYAVPLERASPNLQSFAALLTSIKTPITAALGASVRDTSDLDTELSGVDTVGERSDYSFERNMWEQNPPRSSAWEAVRQTAANKIEFSCSGDPDCIEATIVNAERALGAGFGRNVLSSDELRHLPNYQDTYLITEGNVIEVNPVLSGEAQRRASLVDEICNAYRVSEDALQRQLNEASLAYAPMMAAKAALAVAVETYYGSQYCGADLPNSPFVVPEG